MAARSFVHLDVRSCFSLKEGAFTPEQLVTRAAAVGMPAVTLTDRDGLYGAARFVAACAREGVRPVLGASITVRAERAPDAHVVLLAEDDTGYANLCRLLTDAHLLGARGDPWVATEQICAHAAGLTVLLGPRSHPGRVAAAGRIDAAATLAADYREAFGRDRCVVAVEHRVEARSTREIHAMLRFADRLDATAVATNPVRYLEPADAFVADALECMRRIVPIASTNVTRTNAEGWLKPPERMRFLFAERPDLCDRTLELTERCTFDLGIERIHFPDFPTPAGRSADALLAERSWRGVHERGMREDDAAARPPAPRAVDDPPDGVRGLLPDGGRHRRRHQGDGHLRCVPGERGGLARVLPHRHLRRRRAAARPVVRAVHEPEARRTARCRHRRRVGAPRGRLRHDPHATRTRARRVRRDDRHLPGALGGPRGGQGARPSGGRGRRGGQGVPPHLGAAPPRRARGAAGAPGPQPADASARPAVPGRRAPRRVPAAHRPAPVRDRAREPRSGRAGAA